MGGERTTRPGLRLIAVLATALFATALAAGLASGGGSGSGGAATKGTTSESGASLYVAPGGRNSNPCTADRPCETLGKAYTAAQPGQVVEIAAGSYPPQALPYDGSKTSDADVVFRPAPGAVVTLAAFRTGNARSGQGAKHFELRGLHISSPVDLDWGSEDVTLRGIDSAGIDFTSVRGVRVIGGDYGPQVDGVSHINACGVPGCLPAEDILIDGALFHDFTITDPDKHSECLMLWPGRRVTIRNSTFRNCTDFDVLVKPYKGGLPGEITIENNFFDEPIVGDGCLCQRGGNAIALTDGSNEAWSTALVRHNSALGGIRVDPAVSGVVVSGNVARKDQRTSCSTNATFAGNLWSGVVCSATDRRAPLEAVFVGPDSASFNLHLKAGSPALAAAAPGDALPTDIDGRFRPVTLRSDAGASQRETALVLAGTSIGTSRIGARRAEINAFYGLPRRTQKLRLPELKTPLLVDTHAVRGGTLRVTYRDGVAISLATTSAFYRNLKGIGPGVPTTPAADPKRPCRPVGGPVGKAPLYIRPSHGDSPVVAELIVTGHGYAPPCALPKV